MAHEREDRVEQFKRHMKEEFAKIPMNLSIEDYIDRAERYLTLSLNAKESGDTSRAKKFELLSLKYKQIANEKKNPKPKIEQETIFAEPLVPQEVKKESFFKRLFKRN